MTLAERAQGAELCKRYVERVCACATRDPGFRDQCELARGQPEALEIHLALLAGKQGQLNDNETRAVEGQARAVIRSCVRSDGALDPAACPRP